MQPHLSRSLRISRHSSHARSRPISAARSTTRRATIARCSPPRPSIRSRCTTSVCSCTSEANSTAALPLLDRAVALVPGEPEFHNNRGLALTAADRLDDAVDAFGRALALRPAHAGTWNNLGLVHVTRNALDQADAAYREALALDPRFDSARWNRALALLADGRFSEGWRAYEARLAIPQFKPPALPCCPGGMGMRRRACD